jgi:hypothetical protein
MLVSKTGNKAKLYSWVERLYEKLFYESNNKRHDFIDKSKLSSLSGSSKSFLEDLYDHFENNNAIYLTAFKDNFNRMPNNTDDKIYAITSNHFGGFGRTAPPQSKISTLPFPPNDVINNLIKVFMDSKRKEEIVELAKQLGILEK